MPPPDTTEPPRHGFRGAPTPPPVGQWPRGVTVAVSREAGARGGEVAAAAGRLLGWPVYTQEMLDFLAPDEALADAPAAARAWADAEWGRVARARGLAPGSDPAAVGRLVLALAAKGEAVLVGRGAGFVLPAATTVHVRVVAPRDQRVGYLADRLRLAGPDAAAEVDARDRRRAEFVAALAGGPAADPAGYDLVVNTARLGVAAAADLVAAAVRAKHLPGAGA